MDNEDERNAFREARDARRREDFSFQPDDAIAEILLRMAEALVPLEDTVRYLNAEDTVILPRWEAQLNRWRAYNGAIVDGMRWDAGTVDRWLQRKYGRNYEQ